MFWRPPTIFLTRVLPVLLVGLALGCGSDDGSYHVSGKITFKGQPVPAGKIFFIPDTSKGNSGATGFADIKDGKYDTSATGGKGAPSGPVLITVEGIDPSGPPPGVKVSSEITTTVLFQAYETKADLPKAASTKDIDVPASAAMAVSSSTKATAGP